MADLLSKSEILGNLHNKLSRSVELVKSEGHSSKQSAQRVNALVALERGNLIKSLEDVPADHRGRAALLIQYCTTVVGLEYRHSVWPYEYMAFSRRIGELWEAFCRTAWTYPLNPAVKGLKAPAFSDVRSSLLNRVTTNIGAHDKGEEIMVDVSTLFEIVGDVNMKEDEVFTVNNVPHVIDFKSGFGSNEKGNMLRLLTVGRAYKIWDSRTELMLLVRQEANNNYLQVLRRSGLWSVYTGDGTYNKIHELTGADIKAVRDEAVDWRADLTPRFYAYLKSQPTDLTTYLAW